jgi:hypothetical protein
MSKAPAVNAFTRLITPFLRVPPPSVVIKDAKEKADADQEQAETEATA